jgi:hypothetical protein
MEEQNLSVDSTVYPYYEHREFWFSKESVELYREQHRNRLTTAREHLNQKEAAKLPQLVCVEPIFKFAYETRWILEILIHPTLRNKEIPKGEKDFPFSAVMIRDFLLIYADAVLFVCNYLKPTDYLSIQTVERCYRLAAKVDSVAKTVMQELLIFPTYKEQAVLISKFLKASKPLNVLFSELRQIGPHIERRRTAQQTTEPKNVSKSSDTDWTQTTKGEFDRLLKTHGYPTRQTCDKHQGEPGIPEIKYDKRPGKGRLMEYRNLVLRESAKNSIE